MEKEVLDHFIRPLITKGTLTITYWDGQEVSYGQGEPAAHIAIKEKLPVGKLLKDPMMVLGEAYMDGAIEPISSLYDAVRLIQINGENFVRSQRESWWTRLRRRWRKEHGTSLAQQKEDIRHHYDLGNDFYALWLDETMSYSCAYFHAPEDSLYQAQLQKIDHILRKLQLKPGERLLDIGCGWGWLIIRAAQQYGVQATGITLSEQQLAKVRQRIADLGLSQQVSVELADYRTMARSGQVFDKVVSVGMFEHVGRANLPLYMEAVDKMLVPGGLSLLHSITHGSATPSSGNTWMLKYIFPGGYVPTLPEVIALLPPRDFHLLDAESLRIHYAMTLDHWRKAFEQHVDQVRAKFGERFVRMWRLYLTGAAATFRYTGLDIYQYLFSKGINNDLPLTRAYMYAQGY